MWYNNHVLFVKFIVMEKKNRKECELITSTVFNWKRSANVGLEHAVKKMVSAADRGDLDDWNLNVLKTFRDGHCEHKWCGIVRGVFDWKGFKKWAHEKRFYDFH